MPKTVVSEKGQVVIPKEIRDKIGLSRGTVLRVWTEGKRIVLEPLSEPPKEVFVMAGSEVTRRILGEAKATSDKIVKLLRDLGVKVG